MKSYYIYCFSFFIILNKKYLLFLLSPGLLPPPRPQLHHPPSPVFYVLHTDHLSILFLALLKWILIPW